jgi:capsular exopolysaccharide synthesis family protein
VSQDDASADRDVRHYLHVLRRRKWGVIFTVFVVTAIPVGLSLAQTPVYRATADLLIQESATSGSRSVFGQTNQAQTNATVLVGTQMEIVTSRPVRDAVTKQLGTAPAVTVSEVGQTDVIRLLSTSTNARQAARVANAWANAYIDFTRTQDINSDLAAATQIQSKVVDLQNQINGIDAKVVAATPADKPSLESNLGPQRDSLVSQQGLFTQRLNQLQVDSSLRTGAAQLVTPAEAPKSPSSPKPIRNAELGIVVGLLLGMAVAFILDYFDDRVSSTDDLDRAAHNLPNLAVIPMVASWKIRNEAHVISVDEPTSAPAEAYRTLRTALLFVGLEHATRIIQITSPNAAEGKTTTLANLGVALANAGQRVCLCCCDLRRPRIHEFFGLQNAVGLTSVVLGEQSLSNAVQRVPAVDNLFLLASGPQPPNPSELLASPRASEVLSVLGTMFDVVLLDCPPILPVTDAVVIAGIADATLLTVTAGVTLRRDIARAIQILQQVHAPLIGTIFNGVTPETAGGYYRYSYYRSSSRVPDDPTHSVPEAPEPFEQPQGSQIG